MSQILITVPKYVAIARTPRIKEESCSSAESDLSEFLVRGNRKRKLDHLSWEEKVQRKKLKNRVAAQTSRDRKKAKMEDMEKTIEKQSKELEALKKQCNRLQNEKEDMLSKYEKLEQDYQKLKLRMDIQEEKDKKVPFNNIPEEHKYNRSFDSEMRSAEIDAIKCEGSAVEQKHDIKFSQTSVTIKEPECAIPVADNSTMPALQDLLEDFDVNRLEELAESLLADVTTTMETGDSGSSQAFTKVESIGERLFGSVVGSIQSNMESPKNSRLVDFQTSEHQIIHENFTNIFVGDLKQSPELETTANEPAIDETYEIYTDDEIPVAEIITTDTEEDERDEMSLDEPLLKLLSPIPSKYENYKSSKSPFTSITSDYGYESHLGSPRSSSISPTNEFAFENLDIETDDFWDNSLRELFPSLT